MNDAAYINYLSGLGAEAAAGTASSEPRNAWGKFADGAGKLLGSLANTAMESYATKAADDLAKSLGTPAAGPSAKAAAAAAKAPTSVADYAKYALIVGVPLVGLLGAVLVWRMSK